MEPLFLFLTLAALFIIALNYYLGPGGVSNSLRRELARAFRKISQADQIDDWNAGTASYDIATPQIAAQIIYSWFPHDSSEYLPGPVPFFGKLERSYDARASEWVIEIKIFRKPESIIESFLCLAFPDMISAIGCFTVRMSEPINRAIDIKYYWTGHQAALNDSSDAEFKILQYMLKRCEKEFTARGYQRITRQGTKSAADTARARTGQVQASKMWWRAYVEGGHHFREYTFWPTPQDYAEAVQNPAFNFKDEHLQAAAAQTNIMGIPKVASGMFASVYEFARDTEQWAVRCFNTKISDQHIRYKAISKFILADDLTYTVDFNFIEDGIKVNGTWFPILKMNWVNGATLEAYVRENIYNPEKLKKLRSNFRKMMAQFKKNGIAHGDLQHGNILVCEDQLFLVDYDGFYVPELAGHLSNELGQPNFQHPGRSEQHFGPYLDNFSAWVIDRTLQILIEDSQIWHTFQGGDECLLFRRADFLQANKSKLFNHLKTHNSGKVKEAGEKLLELLGFPFESVPYLDTSEVLTDESNGELIDVKDPRLEQV